MQHERIVVVQKLYVKLNSFIRLSKAKILKNETSITCSFKFSDKIKFLQIADDNRI